MNMDTVKSNCDQWVDYAYSEWLGWIRKAKKEQYYLGEPTKIYVRKMREASSEFERGNLPKREEVWNLLERLKKLGTNINGMRSDFGGDLFSYEQAEIYLECAIVAYKMGDIQEAASLLLMPISNFQNRSIHKSVSCWLYGCIQWQSQTHLEEALVNWEKSYRIMNELAVNSSFEQTFADECRTIASDMNNAICRASENNCPPPPPVSPKSSIVNLQESYFRMFPVIGSIPAGSPVSIVDDATERAISNGFEINNESYKAYSLNANDIEININQNRNYYLLKVNGNSMNAASPINIEDGDYVLMVKQDDAGNGDIVAAEIQNEDREATLKKYFNRNGQHVLEPQSRDETLKEHLTFKKDFYIRGKVVAVLKRDVE